MARTNYDESRISEVEFAIRRRAIGLEYTAIERYLGVSKPAIDKWERSPSKAGAVKVPKHARAMLEMAEGDIEGTVEILAESNMQILPAVAPDDWPWGERCWHTVVARAAYLIRQKGIDCVIGHIPEDRIFREEDPVNLALNNRTYLGLPTDSLGSFDETSG